MIYFNPLSMNAISDEETCFQSLRKTLQFLKLVEDKFVLCLPSNGPDLSMSGGISFKSLIPRIRDTELQTLMITILSDSTNYLGEYPQDFIEFNHNLPLPAFETYRAYPPKYEIILSLHTSSFWEENKLQLTYNGTTTTHLNTPINNINDFSLAIDTWGEIIKYVSHKKEESSGYFKYSNTIFDLMPKWILQLYDNNCLDPQLKLETIRTMARFIAELNEYSYDDSTTQKNRRSSRAIRDIYYNEHKDIYISTDIIHGRFEVLDRSGSHLCEIDFRGNITKGQDRSGQHNIVL